MQVLQTPTIKKSGGTNTTPIIYSKNVVFAFFVFALTTNVTEYVNVENENASPTSETDVAFDM